jgi:indolepyruvate ferredoxin oxidoreductase, beta subunit
MKNPLNLIITGVGGQGNVVASQILGQAAIKQGFRVTIGETFGLSQRGGAVMSHIRLSETRNYGPLIPPNMAHVIVGLEPLETLRTVESYANEDTVFIANSRPIHPLNVIAGDVAYPETEWIRDILVKAGQRLFWLNATEKALELGGPIILNMIMLGALCALEHFPLTADDIQGVVQSVFSASRLPANAKALELGGDMIRTYEN